MSRWWKSYNHFSSIEKKGICCLLILISLLVIINVTMKYWVSPKPPYTDPQLLASYHNYKQQHALNNFSFAAADEPISQGTLFPFDPNILDSNGFVQLGLSKKTTHMLLNWRRKGKIFYDKEEFKKLYTLKEETYKRLEPYIIITSVASGQKNFSAFKKQAPLPDHIDLNATDSSTLVRLNGIGPTLAHKIIDKRKSLGGYVKYEQLNEVYKFSDTIYKMLREKLVINTKSVRKYNLNKVSVDEIKSHPYIGEKMAKNIIMFREGLKGFGNIEQLRQVPLMNEENYRKIAPYFVLE